jgi:hypothetical protein
MNPQQLMFLMQLMGQQGGGQGMNGGGMGGNGMGMGGDPQQALLMRLLGGGGIGGVNPATGAPNNPSNMGMRMQGIGTGGNPNPQLAYMQQLLNPPPSPMQQVLQGIQSLQQGQAAPAPMGGFHGGGNPLMTGGASSPGGGMSPQQQQLMQMAMMTRPQQPQAAY